MKKRIRASMVCTFDNKILVFKGIDPYSGKIYWFLPGGSIEPTEKPYQCAERETLEETGYKVKALPETEIVKHYDFTWDNIQYDCTTYFYKGVLQTPLAKPATVKDAEYNKGADWLPIENIEKDFGYTEEIKAAIKTLV
jgi:8-oxo-dGTP pyrophosphatase MutT (NUDIX family)